MSLHIHRKVAKIEFYFYIPQRCFSFTTSYNIVTIPPSVVAKWKPAYVEFPLPFCIFAVVIVLEIHHWSTPEVAHFFTFDFETVSTELPMLFLNLYFSSFSLPITLNYRSVLSGPVPILKYVVQDIWKDLEGMLLAGLLGNVNINILGSHFYLKFCSGSVCSTLPMPEENGYIWTMGFMTFSYVQFLFTL